MFHVFVRTKIIIMHMQKMNYLYSSKESINERYVSFFYKKKPCCILVHKKNEFHLRLLKWTLEVKISTKIFHCHLAF